MKVGIRQDSNSAMETQDVEHVTIDAGKGLVRIYAVDGELHILQIRSSASRPMVVIPIHSQHIVIKTEL